MKSVGLELCIERVAIRAILTPEPDSNSRRAADEQADEFAQRLIACLRPRPLASTRPSNVVQMPQRKAGSR